MEAIRQRQLADQQRVEAVAARNAEQVARKEETRQRQKAQQQASLALKQSQVAQQQRSLAEQEKARAEKALQQAEMQTRRADEEARKAAEARFKLDLFNFLSEWHSVFLEPYDGLDPSTGQRVQVIGLEHFIRGAETSGTIVIDGVAVNWRDGITRRQAIGLLGQDLRIYEKGIDSLVKVKLNRNQRLALTSFVYQLGLDAFENSTLLKMINSSHFDQVPSAFMIWVNTGTSMEPGLRKRRQAEVNLWNTPP